ncbi:endolytic transglycosylase MltG [Tessaracoccus antarcticus]|uniref:endolytic transglycosylase MltG n=1 Tax=Tessaracoccus antarcticus TaxID=2479848 RepID=UPI001314D38D|nr:endolytic transglycosylase MltG [Tessaracoccus antarcticus]
MSPAFVDNDGKFNWQKIGYHARSAFAVLLSIAVLVGGGLFVYQKADEAWTAFRTEDDYIGDGVKKVEVVVPNGASITQIGDILTEEGVIKSTGTFRKVANKNPDSAKLQAGRYRLLTELPAKTALDMLLDPNNLVLIEITIPEGKILGQQWTLIEEQLVKQGQKITRQELAAAINGADLGLPDWSRGKLEGFMFPDTYRVGEPVDPARIFRSQSAQFNKVAADINLVGGAQALGVDPFNIVTVASIIEREAARAEDRPKVAAVIYNRLRADMPLQFDSTVHFAIGVFDRVTTTAADRATDSPYNTYLYKGLPPGAISNPGKAALEAALQPADITALFFTTVNLDTGETAFANTAAEHAVNVAKFQAWCQANTGRCS